MSVRLIKGFNITAAILGTSPFFIEIDFSDKYVVSISTSRLNAILINSSNELSPEIIDETC